MHFCSQPDVILTAAQDEPPNVCVARTHTIFIPTICVLERSLSVSSCLSSLVSLCCLLLSSTLYLHSDQYFLSNVTSVEGIDHFAFAQRGVLPHGEKPFSHMLDEGFMAEARAETLQQQTEEVYTALQYAASFYCLVEQWKDCEELKPKPKEKWIFVVKKSEETKHRTELCAEAGRYRCMRCGRGSKFMKLPEKCTGPSSLAKKLGNTDDIWEVMIW